MIYRSCLRYLSFVLSTTELCLDLDLIHLVASKTFESEIVELNYITTVQTENVGIVTAIRIKVTDLLSWSF